jgi:hypothetical protein
VRTNAEKQQAQRRIESILKNHHQQLNTAGSSSSSVGRHPASGTGGGNAKTNSVESRFNSARLRVLCLLSNSYALWFIYLADYLRQYSENRKMGLNYAYQVELLEYLSLEYSRKTFLCFI